MPILTDFEYFKPKTIAEALQLLDKYKEKAKILAGGTDLIVQLKEDILSPEIVIDIKDIPDANRIEEENGFITIGNNVTFTQIMESQILKEKLPLLCQTAQKVASVGIRNRATLAGNICSAVPSLDSAPALLNYDAIVIIKNKVKQREITIHDWFVAPKKTALATDELVVGIKIKIPKKHKSIYQKLGRYQGEDLAQAGLGVLLDESGKVSLAMCAVGPIPKRLRKTEEFLNNNKATQENWEKAAEILNTEISPITDIRATERYRRQMMKVMLKRSLEELYEGGLK